VFAKNTNREVRLSLILGSMTIFLLAGSTPAQNVTTQHNDAARTGANTGETVLTPSNVNANNFGKLFYYVVDGYVVAQPLYMANITMGAGTPQAGTKHNVVFVATEHDSVYAFDADGNLGPNSKPLWQITLLDSAHGVAAGATATPVPASDMGETDLVPEVGITGTPVIDPATNTIYLVGKIKENGVDLARLHALDIATGAEKFGGPVLLAASVPGNGNGSSGGMLKFDPKWTNQRTGLLLLNGIVYFGFGSHEDTGPYHGWILGYDAATLKLTGAWCSTSNGLGGGIWLGGSGLAAVVSDPVGHPYGRLYAATGNGAYDAVAPNHSNTMNYGDSVIKLDLAGGAPTMISGSTTVGDDFTPYDQANLSASDKDQGSGGVLILPDSVSGGQHLLVQVGKSARIYVLNQDNLGGYTPANTSDPQAKAFLSGEVYGMGAFWNGHLYFWASNDRLKAFSFSNGAISPTPTSTSVVGSPFPGSTPTVSANGTTNGIVWNVRTDAFDSQGPEILYAHNAADVSNPLYSSDQNPNRDTPGNAVKFVVPTVASGKVYVGAEYQLSVYGLLNGATQAAQPVINPAGQMFHPSVQVTITDSSPNAQIFYTTDGSAPTTASAVYTGPFNITSTQTVRAIAGGPGYLASLVASETYTLINQVPMPVFNLPPGNFTSPQSVAITDTWSSATIYYTTDGSTPTKLSKQYSGPVTISATSTLKAIATDPNLADSPVASGLYTIVQNAASSINFETGFTPGAMAFVGQAKLNGTHLRVTDGGGLEAAAAWYPTPVNVQGFSTDFAFQQTPGTNPYADGFTFTIQGVGTTAVGPLGGGLGYGATSPGGTPGIPKSVAVKFDLFSNAGEGNNSTGLYLNGAAPMTPAVALGGGVDLQSQDIFAVHIGYDGTTLTLTITDTANTSKTFTTSWPVNIPGTVAGNTAYVGFTGGTGHYTVVQDISYWTYVSNASGSPSAAMPIISPATGTYTSSQTVTITDSTAGSNIFYTLDGSPPSPSSTPYPNPFTVSATTTVKAIATASGFSQSPTATSVITINSQPPAATPMISPVTGTYSSAQTVTITDSTASPSIFYTLDGSPPSPSSTPYTNPFTVSTTTTVKAIATASGFTQSNTATSVITIQSGGSTAINFASGFTTIGLSLNGQAKLNGSRLQLTDGGASEASSAWFTTAVNVQAFTTDFAMQLINPNADGMTFAIQNAGTTALGPLGGGLGYGPGAPGGTPGIPTSVAVKFDLFQNAQEGINSTGLYTNGASPTSPAITLGGGVNLHSGDIFQVHMTYDGTTLTMTITDTVTNATFTTSWTINIPATVGGNTAFVGFTGGTGGQTATQQIISWTYSSNGSTQPPAATPVISPATGTYTSSQTVTITDSTASPNIFYTLDGSPPSPSSTPYTNPFTVSTTTTVKAIATASGFSQSPMATSVITINSQSPAATPVISPATGTYTSSQTVTITDSTAGSNIFYTLDGSPPSPSSTPYTNPFTVSTTTTVKAIATASGFTQSNTATSVITIQSGGSPTINFASGFTATGLSSNGRTTLNGTRLRLTDGGQLEASSAWFATPVNVQTFTTDFSLQLTNPNADGMTFTIQNAGTTALGPLGGGLGYGPGAPGGTPGIPTSVAVKFDLFQNAQEGNNSTGLYTNGASPTSPAITLGGGVNLHSGDIFQVHMTYNGTTLTMTITDTVTNATFTNAWTINIPGTVGGSTAFVGFTAGTGGQTATQEIITWTYGP
jgi:hypothetical protein